ncbi:hypothetical protein A2973_04430 [Candidatus Gottesmanbacteria bacterium RIFCSPLOWO2_01_FULL_49_10]|uniref:DipZ thioredoxin-like C-terminal domain-containing protein n=1 Tax=Candidatus Gottesmanbacteria bacterium RIFCSPLOWO2_01_FULL_49_10 TaxID=1798396 RepID=A0A1F6AVW5_9BACT|nr:MAG: hypothetical protein A2973_04430 [Candidatus Gottesmanbacteria bacterium RIFCSPLOWO2_01_FULL_49_10]
MPVDNPTYRVQARTPETYLGNWRIANIASPETIRQDVSTDYSIPISIPSNYFALGGTWTVGYEYARPAPKAKLSFRFDAAEVFLVMRPKTKGVAGGFRVILDGKPLSVDNAGEDVKNGVVKVDVDRLYKLIKLTAAGEHTLELEFLDGTIEVYAFTFG